MMRRFNLYFAQNRVVWLLSFAICAGCDSPLVVPVSEHVEYILPAHASCFRWRVIGEGQEPQRCLEIMKPGELGLIATVYLDSMAFKLDRRDSGEAVVVGPRERGIMTLSTTHVSLMEAWDLTLKHWKGGAYTKFIRTEVAQSRLLDKSAWDISGEPEIDREKLIAIHPAVLTIYPFGDPLSGTSLNEHTPVVPILEYLEPHPLGRAEWMCVFGWMMGDSAERNSRLAFEEIESHYLELKRAVPLKKEKLRVFTGSVQQGTWHAPGGSSFIAQLLKDAGVEYILQDQAGRENIEIPLEEMMVLTQSADAWGLVLHYPGLFGKEELMASDERHAWLMPASGKVFVANTSDCDYFGWWVSRPDAMLENLIALFHPDLIQAQPDQSCFAWIAL
ncbi:MAG: ABC transporter substrate-binding protein [Flavobacteriales bacterium]|nr:ABC transporter substrate-binding protein [Flavobacteriales bacterium]